MKLIDVDEIKWKEGAFLDSETGKPLPIIHKIATIEMLRDWQKPANAIAIPEHATNGDVIKALFPNCIKDSNFCDAVITHLNGEPQYWRKDWWNAPYKSKSEDKE